MNTTITSKGLLFTAILLIISINTFAQDKISDNDIDSIQNENVNLAINESIKRSSITPVDSLLESNQITLDKHNARLYFYKATFLESKYDLENYNATTDTLTFVTKAQEILMYFDSAITKSDCTAKPEYEHGKYLFLFALVSEYKNDLNSEFIEQYKNHKKYLKEKGLKPEKFGLGVQAEYHIGRKQWLGLGFSLFSAYAPTVKYKVMCNNKILKYKPDVFTAGLNVFTFNYAHSLNYRGSDFSFSLAEMYSPIRLIPAKFGFFKDHNSGESIFYYRPGAGLSIGPFSVSYSYNVMLKKSLNSSFEKGFLSFEINYPITNGMNEPKWKD